ncbi:MAG: CbiX/SirB N-terminal domain-containing protein [Euryarchaeota archaeon]|nr:CbiX/SirB N-terminal domain-containing protein [Euryarchaeota archaeon]
MEKSHLIFSNQWQLRKIPAMLLTVSIIISLLSATAYACDSIVENCTSSTNINCASGNAFQADKEKTAVSLFAGGCGTESDPYQIATAEQLNRVRCHLDKNFILINNIDLSGYENWEPIGTFQPLSDKPEDEDTPDPEVAFTGTFDGNGYTVSNLSIYQPEGMAVGLFGCLVGDEENPSSISNLKMKNVDVTGNAFVGGMLGVQCLKGNLERLSLTGDLNTIRGNANVGGIVGGSLSDMKDCNAAADIVLRGDGANHAGVLSGGLEDGSLLNCTATGGTVTVEGDNIYGVGGLAGCVIEGKAATNCHANDVTIIALGENNAMIGGLLGHTGASNADHKTQVTGCSSGVTIIVSDSTNRVGGLVGSGFYLEQYKEYYPVPTMYRIANCSTSGRIIGGFESIGSIAGYSHNSIIENCTSTMTTYRASENVPQVGKEETETSTPTTGILVVAHGSDEDEWNQPVRDAVEGIDCPYPVELGFLEFVEGEDISTAIASLEDQGVEHIITVPIFVASASDHIEEIKYIVGIPSSITEEEADEEDLEVVSHSAEIEMRLAMDDHPLVAEILGERIATVSQQSDQEIVVLVAHGTSTAEDLAVWKNNLASLGKQLKESFQFLDVDYGFVALGEPNARAVVEAHLAENPGASIIVMPVMLSEGTFTSTKIPEVLSGLTYVYPEEGQRSLLPHDKISQLIVARACDAIGVFAGGNGTEEFPYQIATPEQLDRVRYYLDKHFVLIADIDLSKYGNWTPIGTFDENLFENNGHSDIAFSGTFDGNDHTVSNLTATHQNLVGIGLFSVASSDAVIKNLTVENASVIGYMSTAGIIGHNCGSVENLALKGENTISGVNFIGGIVGGHVFGSVKNCTVENVMINVLDDNDFSSGCIIQHDVENPALIEDCSVKFIMNTSNATHIGGLPGMGPYYMRMETVFSINNCSAVGQINVEATPGVIAGRAENCTIGSEISRAVNLDGNSLQEKIGTTDRMYESSDQPESVEDLSVWANSGNGSFESLVNYVNDDALSGVWNAASSSEMAQMMARMFGMNVTDGASLKAMFANMAAAPANNGTQIYLIEFSNDYKTIDFCDQEGNVIESHPYTFVENNNNLGILAGETTYVFKADDDAGVLTYIAMHEPHFDENMDKTTMPSHIHFYYAETKDTLGTYKPDSVTLSSWMPTILQRGDEFSTVDRVAMLECLFGIDNADEELAADIGILVVAHGSDENWNQRVRESVAEVEVPYPVELGFLDTETENISRAVQELEEKGVKRIVAVPIFVCSASSHMEEIKYMLGLPSSLDDAAAQEEGLDRIEKTAIVDLTPALDDHLLIAEILNERLKNLSQNSEKEIVVLVAHGTADPENLAVWQEKMASLGDKLQQIQGFKQVCYGFVGAGKPNIRTVVEEVKNNNPDCTVIVMPVMLSEGVYTDSKIPTSLESMTYLYPEAGQRALLPHANIAQYIAFCANDAIIGDIKLQESGQTYVVRYSDVALEEGGKVCVCGSFAYRAMQEALKVLSPGAVAECRRFTVVGPNSEGTEAALQTILATGRYCLEKRPHNEDYYSYQINDRNNGRTLTIKACHEVFPENFYALKSKIKNNTATSEEIKTFQALRVQVVEKLRWEDADNLLVIEENTVESDEKLKASTPLYRELWMFLQVYWWRFLS